MEVNHYHYFEKEYDVITHNILLKCLFNGLVTTQNLRVLTHNLRGLRFVETISQCHVQTNKPHTLVSQKKNSDTSMRNNSNLKQQVINYGIQICYHAGDTNSMNLIWLR